MKVALFGSTILTLEILKALFKKHQEGKVELAYVVSQPAKPHGRKKELKNNIVSEFCIQNNIKLYTPNKISELFDLSHYPLSTDHYLRTDISIVAAYGKILKKYVLDTAKYGFMNFHPSILPKYRGALPPQMTILNQDEIGGLTIQKMGEGMDDGDIIKIYELEIKRNITFGEVLQEFAELSASAIDHDFDYLFNPEKWNLVPQDDSKATYCYEKEFSKEMLEVKYEDGVKLAHGKIMAGNPEPTAWINHQSSNFNLQLRKLNLHRSFLNPQTTNHEPPTINPTGQLTLHNQNKKLYLELNDGFLEILEIQPEGKNKMDAKSFINGYMRN